MIIVFKVQMLGLETGHNNNVRDCAREFLEMVVNMMGLQSNAIFELFIVVPALLRTTLVSL